MTIFTGCASISKTETTGSISTDITYTYNQDDNTTKISFKLNFRNNTIYNLIREDCTFKLYKDDQFIQNKSFYWNFTVKANSYGTRDSSIVVDGNIDKIEMESWSSTFDNLWNTYTTWWIVAIVLAVVSGIIGVVVFMCGFDFDLENTWASPLISFGIFFAISLFVNGVANWFPLVICLIGIVAGIVLPFILIGIVMLIASTCEMTPNSKEKYSNKVTKLVADCGTNKSALKKLSKDDLALYCNKMEITPDSPKKADLINSIVAYASQNQSTIENAGKNQKNSRKKTKSKNITFDDIAGLDKAKEAFREKVILPFEHKELYKKFGKKVGGGILLYGLPGTGKTMFAEATSNEADALFIPVKCSDIKSKWYGESEQKVKGIFTKARKSPRAIIFFDEFEAIGAKRTDNADNGNNDLVPEILAEMQGVGTSSPNSTIIVIAATNKPWLIDTAFLRPGRFDEKIYVPLPDATARIKLFELKLKDVPTEELNFEQLATLTDGFNGADITEFCERLKMQAINQSINGNTEHLITMQDALNISKDFKSSVSLDDIEKLKQFENN